jgi:hypothetical protein
LVGLESAMQSVTVMAGMGTIELKEPTRDCGSHSPNHDDEGGDFYDGGGMNEGPTHCTGKPH